jgi:hypothetical protein
MFSKTLSWKNIQNMLPTVNIQNGGWIQDGGQGFFSIWNFQNDNSLEYLFLLHFLTKNTTFTANYFFSITKWWRNQNAEFIFTIFILFMSNFYCEKNKISVEKQFKMYPKFKIFQYRTNLSTIRMAIFFKLADVDVWRHFDRSSWSSMWKK